MSPGFEADAREPARLGRCRECVCEQCRWSQACSRYCQVFRLDRSL